MNLELNEAQQEFLQSIEGDLTADQAAQLLELGEEGDTGKPEPGSEEPGASPKSDDDPNKVAAESGKGEEGKTDDPDNKSGKEGEPPEHNADNAVILAKDGKHTISYDKLTEAREGEKAAKAQLDEANRKLAEYEQQAQARADAGKDPTAVDQQAAIAQQAIDAGVDPALFGDFSEEAMAKGIAALVSQQVAKAMEPLKQKEQKSEAEAHFGAIYEAHADADSILESKEFEGWIAGKPSYLQSAINDVLDNGNATQVIEVFSNYKEETGKTQARTEPETDPEKVKAAAKEAVAKAGKKVPETLSDFPGGRAGDGLSRDEQLANMEGADLVEAMANMPKDQIDAFLNRQL